MIGGGIARHAGWSGGRGRPPRRTGRRSGRRSSSRGPTSATTRRPQSDAKYSTKTETEHGAGQLLHQGQCDASTRCRAQLRRPSRRRVHQAEIYAELALFVNAVASCAGGDRSRSAYLHGGQPSGRVRACIPQSGRLVPVVARRVCASRCGWRPLHACPTRSTVSTGDVAPDPGTARSDGASIDTLRARRRHVRHVTSASELTVNLVVATDSAERRTAGQAQGCGARAVTDRRYGPGGVAAATPPLPLRESEGEPRQEHRNKAGFETRAIHAGYEPDAMTGAVIPPIYATSPTSRTASGGLRGGYEYSRSANPTRTALEGNLAALEEGERGFAFACGLAAEDTLVRALLRPGDHVVIPDDAYGGTYRLFDKVAKRWGLTHSPAPVSDVDAVRAAIRPGGTKLVWVETPTNPLLNIGDIEALAERRPRRRRAAGRRQHVRLAVPPAAADPRRRRRRALDDEVRRRALRRRRRSPRRARPRARREGRASTRTPWAPSPARSTRG